MTRQRTAEISVKIVRDLNGKKIVLTISQTSALAVVVPMKRLNGRTVAAPVVGRTLPITFLATDLSTEK